MSQNNSGISEIVSIDKDRRWMPFVTFLFLAFLVVLVIWVANKGSFRLYASGFFLLYSLTKSAWISIILVSISQNLLFLPLRVISHKFNPEIKAFENELKQEAQEREQQILLTKKITEGNLSVIFYILNFVLLALAFFSAGRFFLLDFYKEPISTEYLYGFVPYPEYPMSGVIFNFPFFKVTETIALNWKTIFLSWIFIFLFAFILRLLWRITKFFLWKNKGILRARIGYNRLRLFFNGFALTLFLLSLYFLRHIPISLEGYIIPIDLSVQNTGFNIVTAIATFLATLYSGFQHSREGIKEARVNNIPEDIIKKVARQKINRSIKNGFFLALAAYIITHQMPCSHDLSVLSFEFIYIIAPYTIDRLVISPKK